ncbi:hypothetical protein Vadar_031186 [Vaccinium darrowii]|uniref:Uncharacterized protein n=1 Tax=Vaccinium darrowii TaxID=229202 RepID=A0ACB7ZGB4_9ERIC|nr:hypothetical protein Vadar_031186 [Vaccinium darrowii]
MRGNKRQDINETIFDENFKCRNWGLFGERPHKSVDDSSWVPFNHMKTSKFRMPKFSTKFGANVTLFVGNLPEDMDTEWLSQLFSISGYVIFATIPNRRSYMHNDRCGFIKFASKKEGLNAIKSLNGMHIRGHNILVKWARLSIYPRGYTQRKHMGSKSNHDTQFWKPKFAPLLNLNKYPGTSKKIISPIKVMEVGNEWLYMSVIAKLPADRSLALFQDHIQSLSLVNIIVRPRGVTMSFLLSVHL